MAGYPMPVNPVHPGIGAPLINPNMLLLHLLGQQNPIQGAPLAQATNNPQLWENRHPAAVAAGNIPAWVSAAFTQQADGVPNPAMAHLGQGIPNPGQGGAPSPLLQQGGIGQDVIPHPGSNGPIHPAQLHQMMAALAQQVRAGRVSRAANRIPTTRPAAPTAY